jgi:hypothetical protein
VRAQLQGINWKGVSSRRSTSRLQSINVYDQARITVEFEEVDYQIYNDAQIDSDPYSQGEFGRYVTFTTDSSVDYLSIPLGSSTFFEWSDGPSGPVTLAYPGSPVGSPAQIPDAPGKSIPGFTFHWRWHQVPYNYVPYTAIANTLGRVNKTTFAGCAPQTLLLIAKDQELKKAVDGSWQLDLIYSVRYLATGWNNVFDWRADPMAYFQIAVNGIYQTPGFATDGKLIFDEREFANLFKVQAF